jgi:DNA polymerase I-like protein with 3'-5' exonuclease and polymerase domains
MAKLTNTNIYKMEELINFLNLEYKKIEELRNNKNVTEVQKNFLDGMKTAFDRVNFEIEINGIYLEKEEIKSILQTGYNACCGKQLSEKSIELFFKSNE